jgi:hypothetical protein
MAGRCITQQACHAKRRKTVVAAQPPLLLLCLPRLLQQHDIQQILEMLCNAGIRGTAAAAQPPMLLLCLPRVRQQAQHQADVQHNKHVITSQERPASSRSAAATAAAVFAT